MTLSLGAISSTLEQKLPKRFSSSLKLVHVPLSLNGIQYVGLTHMYLKQVQEFQKIK